MALAQGPPTLVSASNTGGVITLILNWPAATGGTPAYTYAVQASGAVGFNPFATYVTGVSGLTYTFTTPTYGLPPGSFHFRIKVTDSTAATATSTGLQVNIPQVLIAQPLSVTTAGGHPKLTWSPSIGGVNPPYTYDVQRSPNSNMSGATDLGSQTSPFTDTSYTGGVVFYQVTVTDTNSPVQDTAYSNTVAYGMAPQTMSTTGVNLTPTMKPIPPGGMELYGYVARCTHVRNLGEKFGIICAFKPVGTPLKGYDVLINATFDCWDENGNQLVTGFQIVNINFWGSQWCQLRYVMLTGPNKVIQSPGTFTYQFTVNLSDGSSTIFQQVALINPTP